ncbi:hydrocephalus-inducing protein homolog [Leptidea sinapis]|uniref:hydrocephalus-inducing protein homolog n=1 Tax=Leptidea sinapis TaxID=189913 RepID=UPI0021C42EFD|nr:hydrocephalus-inducing protein homolog [Leptidea sinapis]
MENCGTRLHALEWSEHYKAPKTKQQATSGFFNLDPRNFKMAAGEKMELSITGLSYKVATVKEMWYLVGSVEGINKKELLLECLVIAEFVDPKIEISSNIIDCQYDYGPYSEYYKLTDIVTIKNVSKLPLDFDISVKPPFAMIHKGSYKVLQKDLNLCGCICYNKSDLNISNMLSVSGPYQSKVFTDFLTQKPVDPLRNEPLHFFQDIYKIKLAFSLTHAIEERLDDQETMKIQVLFDTTKHTTLKSRVYCDLMKIKFKGHKNKDAIKLIGKINFPNMSILTPRVDFQCVLNGSIESRTIKIQNVTPLLVCYRFNWKKYSITDTKMLDILKQETKVINQKSSPNESETTASRTQAISMSTAENMDKLDKVKEHPRATSTVIKESSILAMTMDQNFDDLSNKRYMMMKIITPMIDVEYNSQFEWIHKFSKLNKSSSTLISDVLQLSPHRGLLKPNEIQYVQVIFRPTVNMNIRAVLECEVLGGPNETIQVTGQSCDLMYRLSTQNINFKIRSFHENAIEQFTISNIAQLPFEYTTYLNEPKYVNALHGTIVSVDPDKKKLEPEEYINVNIEVKPGAMGYFNSIFLLEIGHLPLLPIEVFGWGVIPQVYISLPRPEIVKLHPLLGYQAIPSLTEEYLEAVREIFMRVSTEHLNSPSFDKCFEDPMFQKEWHLCSPWDAYPSIFDIELAIERMLVINHVELHPEILNTFFTASKQVPIPGFLTTPYVIDYGVVITGSTIQCCVDIINYGPIVTKLHLAKGTHLPSWLGLKICGKLNPGETGKLEATFTPNSTDFTELEQFVETSFNIEVLICY